MKFLGFPITAFVAALLCSHSDASVIATRSTPIAERQIAKVAPRQEAAQITREIFNILKEIFKGAGLAFPEVINAWEFDKLGYMCEIYMETRDGANCYATVECNDGKKEYNEGFKTWNACYQGGRQYFTDPRIGDFSITFTDKNNEGEGLTGPVLQLKDISNWKELHVTDMAREKWKYDDCVAHAGIKCGYTQYICRWVPNGYDNEKGRVRRWACGVPKQGLDFPGLDSDKPVNERGYAPGWCGVHVTHYQKPNPSKDPYSLEAKVFDANSDEIGNSAGKHDKSIKFGSKLPLPFIVSTGAVDKDPVYFEYDGKKWDSNSKDHQCNVGAYDNNKREMDCGFTCN